MNNSNNNEWKTVNYKKKSNEKNKQIINNVSKKEELKKPQFDCHEQGDFCTPLKYNCKKIEYD